MVEEILPHNPEPPEATQTPTGGLPVVLNLTGKTALVVGGGPVGRRKAAAARAAGAFVRIVAPEPCPPEYAAVAGVEWVAEPYRREHLAGIRLVFAAGPPAVNEQVVRDAADVGVWVNAATDPAAGDFALPSVVRRGAFVVAVGTGGGAPGFARRVRELLDRQFDSAVGEFVALLAELRPVILAAVAEPAARRALLDRLADWPWLERLRQVGRAATRDGMAEEIRRAAGNK